MSLEELNELLDETGETPCMSAPDLFFPPDEETLGNSRVVYAKQLCGLCPLRLQCLEYAIDNNEKHGIWGGLTRYERNKISRR
jgi:WhiB family redox-sensing transcriptional regulator